MSDGSVRTGGPGVVAVIPARGGSKGVPGKNLALVAGRTLVRRAVEACTAAGIPAVVVSTDDDDIATEAAASGAHVVGRPAELAGDEATSESALAHALDRLASEGGEPAVLAFVQCTSPFIAPEALSAAVDQVVAGTADCAFAAVETGELLWRVGADGEAFGVNHDMGVRLRRQERSPDWRETGAFYVMRTSGFRASGHRFFGRVRVQPVDRVDAIEIDTPEDLELARAVAATRSEAAVPLGRLDVLVTDFDGVHTDDRVIVGDDGRESVRVSRADGHGIALLRTAGMEVLILSTETNAVVARRAEKLRVACLHGVDDKWGALQAWLDERGIDRRRVAYLGNDVNDEACMRNVGVALCVADGHERIRSMAQHVTQARGGEGAVREVAELLLAARTVESRAASR